MRIRHNLSWTDTHISATISATRADTGGIGRLTRSSGRMPYILCQTNSSLSSLSSNLSNKYLKVSNSPLGSLSSNLSNNSSRVSGSTLNFADHSVCPSPQKLRLSFGLESWPRTLASSLSFPRCLRLLTWQAFFSCHYLVPSPGCLLLLATLLSPFVVGSSVKIVITSGPKCSMVCFHPFY